jgi:membrane protein DedA with SNARE-associated domain
MTMAIAIFSEHTLDHLLASYGYVAVFCFVAIESLGIPFPGETMIIAAAFYAGTTHHLTVGVIWAAAAAGAIVGDSLGFWAGHRGGYRLLLRYGHKVRLDQTKLKVGRLLFDRHGGKVVFLGRFVSILRTYAAFLAGVNQMAYKRFLVFNASGGLIWSGIYALGFYYLGGALSGARTPVDLGLGVCAGLLTIGVVFWTRRHGRRLEAEAEQAYPGQME